MVIRLLLSTLLMGVFGYVAYWTLEPLILPTSMVNKVLFSTLALPYIAAWAIFIFCIISTVVFMLALKRRKEVKSLMKWLYVSLSIGLFVGLTVNYANFYFVIKPNAMVECPAKVGYKKNLMRDYVKDISQCKKF